jgi:hypothetical protein
MQFPLEYIPPITSAQGSNMETILGVIRDVIGILTSPDPASVNAKLNSLISSVGTSSTSNTLLKFLSDINGNVGNPSSGAAASPTSTSTVVGFLKLISSYLQQTAPASSCVKASATVGLTSSIIVASGSKSLWGIWNTSSNPIYIEYGAVATVADGHTILPKNAWIDTEARFTGAVNAIASTSSSITYRVFS